MANENQLQIDKLKRKNTNIYLAASGVSMLGGIGGIVYGISKKKSGWQKFGLFLIGSIAIGVPAGIVSRSFTAKNEDAIDALKNPTQVFANKEQLEQAASDACEPEYEKGGSTAFNKCRQEFIKNNS